MLLLPKGTSEEEKLPTRVIFLTDFQQPWPTFKTDTRRGISYSYDAIFKVRLFQKDLAHGFVMSEASISRVSFYIMDQPYVS